MSKRLFLARPWFWVGVGAFLLVMLAGYMYSMVMSGIKPVSVLMVMSEPTGAIVYWDDAKVGMTPHRFEFEGRMYGSLKLTMDGYQEISGTVDIDRGEKETIKYYMMQDTYLKVDSDPSGANVLIDGELWGSTPCTLDGLIDPGSHTIKVERLDLCLGEVERTVELNLGEPLTISPEDFQLPKLKLLTMNTDPPGVMVMHGEEEWGKTPLSMCLVPDDYTISFVKNGYVTEERDIKLDGDKSLFVQLSDPVAYEKRDHFEVDASNTAEVVAIARKPSGASPIFGKPVRMGKTPTHLTTDELMTKANISMKPYSYVVTASASGYQCGITEMKGPGLVYFNFDELSSSAKSSQGAYRSYSPISDKDNGLESPDSRYAISADRNRAALTEVLSGRTHELYLESDYARNEFSWSPDSRWLWYFRNSKGVRELVRLDTSDWEEDIIDTIDLSQIPSTRGMVADNVLQSISSITYSPNKNRLYYLVPGSEKNKLTLVSNTPGGGNRTAIASNVVPLVDDWSLWLESSGVMRMTGYFPGLVRYEGYYLLDDDEPVHFEITTNPNEESEIGNLKQLQCGMTMFPRSAFVRSKGKSVIISARLLKGLRIIFMYSSTSNEYELIDVITE